MMRVQRVAVALLGVAVFWLPLSEASGEEERDLQVTQAFPSAASSAGIHGAAFGTESGGTVTVIAADVPPGPPNEPSQSARGPIPAHLQVPIDTTQVAAPAADEAGTAAAASEADKGPRLRIASYRDSSTGRDVAVKANELLVRFSAGVTAVERNALLVRHGAAQIGRNTDGLKKLGYSLARVPNATTVEHAIVNLRQEDLIDHVEPNSISRAFENIPAPRPWGEQWGLDAIRARLAWRVTRGDPSVVVAVIDTGVDLRHPDLVENLLPGYDFLSGTGLPQDDHGHGTQIAGIIAATGRMAGGILGVAPNCSILPLKILDAYGEGTIAGVAEAIVYAADHGARIISLALGTYYRSEVLRVAVDYAYASGCVVVAAAGNDGTSEPCYPASYSASVAVASLHPSLRASWFGNRGAYVDPSVA